MAFVDGRDNFFYGYRPMFCSNPVTELSDVLHCLGLSFATLLFVGDNARDRSAVAQHDDRHAALDFVEQLREMSFRDRGLHFAHIGGCGFRPLKGGSGFAETLPAGF